MRPHCQTRRSQMPAAGYLNNKFSHRGSDKSNLLLVNGMKNLSFISNCRIWRVESRKSEVEMRNVNYPCTQVVK